VKKEVRRTTNVPHLLQPEITVLGISCRARACVRRFRAWSAWIRVQNIDRRPRAGTKTRNLEMEVHLTTVPLTMNENVKKEVQITELYRRVNGSEDELETFPG
jgi:hypothetical protein